MLFHIGPEFVDVLLKRTSAEAAPDATLNQQPEESSAIIGDKQETTTYRILTALKLLWRRRAYPGVLRGED